MPAPNTTIWRYMDFWKFISMLESNALFFSNAAILDDPYEASLTKAGIERRKREFPQFSEEIKNKIAILRKNSGVNCWHVCEYENMAMWNTYIRSWPGVVVKTSVERLQECFKVNATRPNIPNSLTAHTVQPKVDFGLVNYIDFNETKDDQIEGLAPLFNKRINYSYEVEFRAAFNDRVLWNRSGDPWVSNSYLPGLAVEVNLETLLMEVHGSPSHNKFDYEIDLIKDILKRYGLNPDIAFRSELDMDPYF